MTKRKKIYIAVFVSFLTILITLGIFFFAPIFRYKVDDLLLVEKAYTFQTTDEYLSLVQDDVFVKNLSKTSGLDISIMGVFNESSSHNECSFSDFSRFEVVIKSDGKSYAFLSITPNASNEANKHIINYNLVYDKTLNDYNIHYSYDPYMCVWNAVIDDESTFYEVVFHLPDENDFMEFLAELTYGSSTVQNLP